MPDNRSYVAIAACGCVASFVSGDDSYRKEAAKSVAKLILAGYEIELWSGEKIRSGGYILITKCPHREPKL